MRPILLTGLLAMSLVGLPGCGGKEADVPGVTPPTDSGQGDLSTTPEAVRAGTLDVSCITDDFFAAAVVRPQKIFGSPVAEGLPLQESLASLERNMGVDPRKVAELIVLVETPPGAGSSRALPKPTAILRFSEPIDLEKLIKPRWASAETVRQGDWSYYREGPAGDLAACAVGDRTAVIAREETLRKIVARRGGTSTLAERLQAADGGADLAAVLLVAPVRHLVEEAAAGAKDEIPKELAAAAAMAEHLEAATLTADLSGDPLARLVLEATGPESVEELEQTAQLLVALAKMFCTSQREEMLRRKPREASQATVELLDELLGGIQVVKEADRVVVTLKRPKEMDTLLKRLAPAVAPKRTK